MLSRECDGETHFHEELPKPLETDGRVGYGPEQPSFVGADKPDTEGSLCTHRSSFQRVYLAGKVGAFGLHWSRSSFNGNARFEFEPVPLQARCKLVFWLRRHLVDNKKSLLLFR